MKTPCVSSSPSRMRFLRVLLVFCVSASIIAPSFLLQSCASVFATRAEYFSYRNTLPVPPTPLADDQFNGNGQGTFQGSTGWTNPMRSNVMSAVAFVPIITPWYDSWSVFSRPSLRFRVWNDWAFGGGMGWGQPWGYDPFWDGGFGSSFMYYSCPWYNFNPYFGGYTPFGFYRPIGWWSSNNFVNVINVVNNSNNPTNPNMAGGGAGTGGTRVDNFTNPELRAQASQRAYSNTNTANSAPYMGSYDGGGYGGGRSRGSDVATYSATSTSLNNKASQYNTSTYSTGAGANDYNARFYGYGSGRSSGGYGGGYSSSGYSSGSSSGYNSSSSSGYNSGSYGGGRSSGGYGGGGSSSGGSYGGSSGGGGGSYGGSSGGSSGGGGGKAGGGYGGGGKR